MSGIGELAYTVLLGWMRALVDWFWAMFSGTGNTSAWQWFLSNWKIWLVVLLIGGLVVDWLMWVVRWRPYRLLTSRFRRAPAGVAPEESWDTGVGFYEVETPADVAPEDWDDTTYATLSEIDPDWAGDVIIDENEEPLYDPEFDPHQQQGYYTESYDTPQTTYAEAPVEDGYWDETPDEADPGAFEEQTIFFTRPQETLATGAQPAAYADEPYYDDEPEYATQPQPAPDGFDPYAPYDAYAPEEAQALEATASQTPVTEPAQETGPQLYGRPGNWPGMQYPFVTDAEPEPEPEPEPYDPLFNPDAPQGDAPQPRRRRRRLRESAADQWQPEDPFPSAPTPEPTWIEAARMPLEPDPEPIQPDTYRPAEPVQDIWDSINARNATPEPAPKEKKKRRGTKRKDEVRTVTGKPAKPRGLFRFTSMQEEAIAGLPPMDLTDPFLPAAKPDNVDFAPDEGEEFDR